MWKVLFTSKTEKEIIEYEKKGLISDGDKKIIAKWIVQVKKYGPDSLRSSNNFWNDHDHDLERDLKGFRSSSYSYSGRIIYKVKGEEVLVKVVRVTPFHDYHKE